MLACGARSGGEGAGVQEDFIQVLMAAMSYPVLLCATSSASGAFVAVRDPAPLREFTFLERTGGWRGFAIAPGGSRPV